MHFFNKKTNITLLSDAELLKLFNESDDQNYLAELFGRYSHLIFLVCVKYLEDREAARDAVMDIYEKLIQSVKKNKIEDFKKWIYSVSKNHCLMIIRKKSSKIEREQFSNIYVMEYEVFLHQEDENKFTTELVREKVKSLKSNQRECIERFYFHKQSYKEIAKVISETEMKVKSYLQNGKRNLRALILDAVRENET